MRYLISARPLRESVPFARLWSAGMLVGVSAQMMQMAIAWTVYEETQSPLAVGGLGLAIGIPTVVFGLVGGVLTDTRRPRMLGMIGVGGQIAVGVLLLVITSLGDFSLAMLYALVFAQSAFGAVTSPTRRPYIRHLLKASSIPAAMSLYMVSMNLGQIIGPILGGLLLARSPIGIVIAFHVVALVPYLLSVLSLPDIDPASQERIGMAAIGKGLQVTWRITDIRTVLLSDLFATVFALPVALLPALNGEVLHGNAATYGALLAALSIGGLAGTLFSGFIGRLRHPVRSVVLLATAWCLTVVCLGTSTGLVTSLIVLLATGLLDAWSVTIQQLVVQKSAPDFALGRVGSIQSMVAMAGPQLGNFRAGVMGSVIGAPAAVVVGGAIGGLLIVGSYVASKKEGAAVAES
ncbi:MFS transporter [Leifsonia sp. 22587]|uniref:MFS transporter n=1 Tax=Leifsonia sp. 22587 TaxID=3453946 RepID=UPI003F86DE01